MATYRTRLALVGVFLLGAAVAAVGLTVLHRSSSPVVHAQTTGSCDNSSLAGTYGALAQGTILTAPDGTALAAPLPLAAINVLVADGAGNLTRTGTANRGGTVSPNPGTGTYTVNPDCTFTLTFTGTTPSAATHVAGVLVAGGTKAFVITTDASPVVAVIWERQ